jgi:hypothetical protein
MLRPVLNYALDKPWPKSRKYLGQYLREFDYRYNVRRTNDDERFTLAVTKTSGKRLTLREPKKTTS